MEKNMLRYQKEWGLMITHYRSSRSRNEVPFLRSSSRPLAYRRSLALGSGPYSFSPSSLSTNVQAKMSRPPAPVNERRYHHPLRPMSCRRRIERDSVGKQNTKTMAKNNDGIFSISPESAIRLNE